MTKKFDDVTFTVAQLRYLEELYPQVVMPPTSTEAAMRYYFGHQAVLQTVRNKTRGLGGTVEKSGPRDTIPSP